MSDELATAAVTVVIVVAVPLTIVIPLIVTAVIAADLRVSEKSDMRAEERGRETGARDIRQLLLHLVAQPMLLLMTIALHLLHPPLSPRLVVVIAPVRVMSMSGIVQRCHSVREVTR